MNIKVNCQGAQCADVPKDEASSTGNLKGRKNVMDAINRGYIFEALDIAHEITENALGEVDKADEALAGCREQLKKLDELRDKLNEVGAVALRTSITNLYSPEHTRDAARDKMLKEAVKLLYEIFGDLDAGREMVLTYTSSLATNAKKALMQNKNAIEVTQGDLKANGLEGDSKELVTFTSAKGRRANAGMAKELEPVIAQAKVVAEAAGTAADATVPASEYQKLLQKLTEMYENANKITMVVTTTPDFQPSDIIKQLKTAPEEAKQNEGFLDKLIDMFKKLASGLQAAFVSLKKQFTDLFTEVEDANDTYAKTSEIMMSMGFAPVTESRSECDGEAPKATEAKEKDKKLNYKSFEKDMLGTFEALAKHPDFILFADEAYMAQCNLRKVREALVDFKESLESLQCLIPSHKNEDNMEVVGILADAIQKIAADTTGDTEGSSGEPTIQDQVSDEYSGTEEPAGGTAGGEAGGVAGGEEPAGGEGGNEAPMPQ